jgi:hypothetical protein
MVQKSEPGFEGVILRVLFTSKAACGDVVFIPTLLLLNSQYISVCVPEFAIYNLLLHVSLYPA